jgi:uncharacterized membrane protein (Fun14 family)
MIHCPQKIMSFGRGGFLFDAVAGYTIKKVMKVAAIIIRLFVVGISYLSIFIFTSLIGNRINGMFVCL